MHLAVGTSFAIIIPTSIVSVLTHNKYKAVDFDVVKSYGIYVVTGVVLGTLFAASLKTKSLVLFFSIEINYYEILGNIIFTFLLYYIFAFIFDIYRKIISRIKT